MTSPRPTFRPITAPLDVDDGTLARLNEQLGVPALVKSPSESPPAGPEIAQEPPEPKPRPSPTRAQPAPSTAQNSPVPIPAPVERLSIELPGYLTDALKRQAAENRSSVRHIVMRGLAALGFDIADRDLVADARRFRKKPRKR